MSESFKINSLWMVIALVVEEPGDFTNGSLSLLKSSEQECNWRFGDVMTFFVTADDMLQAG